MSEIIGTCLGEYAKEGDASYDPQTDIYKIKAGNRIVKVTKDALQAENIKTLQEALSNVDDDNIKMDMLGTWTKARNKPIHYDRDETSDDLYRKIYLGDWGPDRAGEAKTATEAAEDETTARPAAAARIRQRAG